MTEHLVAVVMDAGAGRSARLIGLDRHSGRVMVDIPLAGRVSRLRAAASDRVVLADASAGTVRRVSLSVHCRPGRDDRRDEPPREPRRPQRPPPDHCEPGDDGVDDDCWFTVARGDDVVRINLCDPDADDCRRTLFSRVGQIERVGGRLLAVAERGHALLELEPSTLAVVDRQHLRTPVASLLAAPQAAASLALAADGSILLRITVPATPQAAPGPDFGLALAGQVSEKVVEGTNFALPAPGPQFAVAPLNILLVPMSEPGQAYKPDSLGAYDDVMRNTAVLGTDAPLAIIQRYYAEQSNGQQSLNIDIFGATTPDWHVGPPIPLPEQFQSYYYPAYEPGGIVLTPSLGALPSEYRFTGAERRTIHVISSIESTPTDFNAIDLDLVFPAAIVSFNLGSGLSLSIATAGPALRINYLNRNGSARQIDLDPSVLGSDQPIDFDASMSDLGPSIESLRNALQTILSAADTANDFGPVAVRWVKTDQTLGQINLLFSFAGGSGPERPRISSFGGATFESFLGLGPDTVSLLPGFGRFDPGHADGINWMSETAGRYFERVMLLAEAAASTNGFVPERVLGSASVVAEDTGGTLALTIKLNVSNLHGGGGVATILAGPGVGEDVVAFGQGQSIIGSKHTFDQRNMLKDPEGFFGQVYAAMTEAIDAHTGGLSESAWNSVVSGLKDYDTIFAMPVAPPPGGSGLWSVGEANDTDRLRASVNSGLTISDSNGLAPAAPSRWGVQFMNFDGRLTGNSRTLAHELGHSLDLADQYSSAKFHPALQYLGGRDLMGNAGANWPHFCAYHKLAMGWLGEDDRMALAPPGADETINRRFILGPVEWWDLGLQSQFRSAFPNEPASTEVTGAVVCDLGGDGGMLAVIEARSRGAQFSGSMGDASQPGFVMVTNVLDYGTKGRYGQILPDKEDVPEEAIKGFLRYRRRIHPVSIDLQPGDPAFDMAAAPGFPVAGLEIEVLDRADVTLQGQDANGNAISQAVPAYLCELSWRLGPNADVGFSDNEEEWRSSDIGIDWVGFMKDDEQSGTTHWPVGQPSGVGDVVRIPGSGSEPHEVMVRVWNFGNAPASNVELQLYLRDPGGGGDPAPHSLYDTHVIPQVLPEAEAGPVEHRFAWPVPAGQEPHICWRAEVARFELGQGAGTVPVLQDAVVANNWAQQNIFEAETSRSSPPEPIETRFSVHNDGAFIEHAYLEPRGMPKGVTMRIRPRLLRVPAFTTRHFHIRVEFDEEIADDPCRREMEFLVQCWRQEDHTVEPWGASLFKFKVREETATTVGGSWLGGQVQTLSLSGAVDPGTVFGKVSLRLDFENGQPALWVDTPLSVGGLFDEVVDTSGIQHDRKVVVTATYRGSPLHAISASDPATIFTLEPAG